MPRFNKWKWIWDEKDFILCLGIGLLFSYRGFGQVGEKVFSVNILNMNNDTVLCRCWDRKICWYFMLILHILDRTKPSAIIQDSSGVRAGNYILWYCQFSCRSDASECLIKRMALKEVKGTDGKIYFDPDGILATAWKLPGANNNFTVIFINKNQVMSFIKLASWHLKNKNRWLL